MNNFEIIEVVEKIVSPYFKLNIEDFYGDRGSCTLPKIEELNILFLNLMDATKNQLYPKINNKK